MIGVKVSVWAPETVNLGNLGNIIAAYTGVYPLLKLLKFYEIFRMSGAILVASG